MFVYEKRLQYPIKIANTNPRLASLIISQYGGAYSILLIFSCGWIDGLGGVISAT